MNIREFISLARPGTCFICQGSRSLLAAGANGPLDAGVEANDLLVGVGDAYDKANKKSGVLVYVETGRNLDARAVEVEKATRLLANQEAANEKSVRLMCENLTVTRGQPVVLSIKMRSAYRAYKESCVR